MAPNDYGPTVLSCMWGMFCVTSSVVGLRVYTRVKYAKFGYDDWITLVCWLVFLVTAIPVSVAVSWGFGKHIWDIPAEGKTLAREGQVISTAAIIFSFATPKFGIMATVHRATNPPSGFWQRIFIANWVFCTMSFLFLTGVSVFQILQCQPIEYQWTLTDGYCISSEYNIQLSYAASSFSTFLNSYYSILPTFILWKLQMSQKQRVTMSIMLGGAMFATIASVVKMWKLGNAISKVSGDPTYVLSEVYILIYIEATLLIVGSSFATIIPLYKRCNLRLRGASKKEIRQNGTTLRTFGQGTLRSKRRTYCREIPDEDDEAELTRCDGGVGEDSNTSLEGIVKTTDVEQTWEPADIESRSIVRQKLGLTPGMV